MANRMTKRQLPRLPSGFSALPNGDTLRTALRAYAQSRTYWYIPKVRALNTANVAICARILRVIDEEFSNRLWDRRAQDDLLTRLTELGLLNPTAENPTAPSRTALTRIVKVLLETLGLLWIADNQTPVVTSAGHRLMSAAEERPAAVREIIARQLSKIQYPNPAMSERYRDGFDGLLPHLFLLEVVDRMEGSISFDEYELFVNLATSQEDSDQICHYIDAWRSLDERQLANLKRVFERVPIGGQSAGDSTASTRAVRIGRTSSYQRSIFCYPNYLRLDRSDKQIEIVDSAMVRDILNRSTTNAKVTIFDSREDWFSYFGDPTQEPSWFTYVAHQVTSSIDSTIADAAVEAHEAKLSANEKRSVRRLQVERAIENAYATEPDLLHTLEPALTFEGRQVKTPIGQIDLLCRSADGTYVVVEIKAGAAEDAVFGQILRYMGWIHRNYPDGEHNVRGIILASEFSDKAQYSRVGLMREDAEWHLKFRRHAFAVEEV